MTAHVESVVSCSTPENPTHAFGYGLRPSVARLTIRQLLRLLGEDTVVWHAHRNLELLCGLVLRRFVRRLVVAVTRHSDGPPSPYSRWLLSHANVVITLNPAAMTHSSLPSVVVPHGVDLQRFRPAVAARTTLWPLRGLGGTYGIIAVGRIRPEKGQADFVHAVSPLLAKNPAWRGVCVGRIAPEDTRWAQALFSGTGAQNVDEAADIVPWFQSASVVVVPSLRESFGLVVLEAMASGCCVVAASQVPSAAAIRDGFNGFVYPPGDVEALRTILRRLMETPQLAADLGQRALATMRNDHAVQREQAQLLATYASAGRRPL